MAWRKVVSKEPLLRKQPNSIKKVIQKVQQLNKLGSVLDKEVAFLQKELGEWVV